MTGAMLVFSILQPIENAVRWVLERFHYNLHLPWAWAIVATTITVRIVLVPLTVRQIHSMQAMQKHGPALKELQKKYKGDRQKLSEEQMKFFKENNINPAASCLPLVAQLPVFFSLYLVLKHFAKHLPPGDLSWLHIVPNIADKASAHWSGYLLLGIYAVSQILSTWFMSTTMDKSQRYIMMVVPLVFISFIARFPVGLVLYWVTTNLWTVGQGVITRRLVPKTPLLPPGGGDGPKRTSRNPPKNDGGDGSAPAVPKNGGGGNGGSAAELPKADGASTQPAKPKPPQGPRRVKRKKGARR